MGKYFGTDDFRSEAGVTPMASRADAYLLHVITTSTVASCAYIGVRTPLARTFSPTFTR